MSADDQAFLDVLSAVPNDIRRYSSEVADYIDKHLENVAGALRDALSSAQWIPESARPRPRPPPTAFISMSPASTSAQICDWVMKNKILTSVIVVAAGGLTYHVIRRRKNLKKRRAKRAMNGARLEVVVIAGSPSEPITRSISLDLERRGFIVYIVCNTIEEEVLVQNESRADIKPLMIDIVDPSSARSSIERFTEHLQSPHAAFHGARPNHLTLRSLILIPSPSYPSSPIATLSPPILSDLLNTRLLNPILTVQMFLPLLTSLPIPHLHHNAPAPPKPSVLVLTPTIIPSLSPAFHAPESSIIAALTSFTRVLSAELSPLNIPVTHLQLGNFDISAFSPHSRQIQLQTLQSQRAETLKWEDGARQAYGRNFVALSSGSMGAARSCGSGGGIGKGSSLRELNNAVFDAMVRRGSGGTVRVGMGSIIYGFVGNWVPKGLVGWMMGVRGVGDEYRDFGRGGISSEFGSRSTSPRSAGGSNSSSQGGQGNVTGLGLGESEYIAVYDGEKEEKTWRDS